ncbi:MAG: class II aldolase/adducin family protein [Treponema sp.]|nr:class II aldolase/adducin family protein [Treponema sp.]
MNNSGGGANMDAETGIREITALSRRYGADRDYVIAGGGNTSYKNSATLWIKGSGVALGDMTPDDFIAMDRKKLAAIWEKALAGADGKSYPAEEAAREAAVLADMMAAKKTDGEKRRPSVETLLHDLLPFAYVVHTHPPLVNGMCCGRDGRQIAASLFGAGALWIPCSDPGFVLAVTIRKALEEAGTAPSIILLQNHGIFAAADASEAIDAIYRDVMSALHKKIIRSPDFGGEVTAFGESGRVAASLAAAASKQAGAARGVSFIRNNEIARLVSDRASFGAAGVPFTPDHIVYAGSDPLFIERGEDVEAAFRRHCDQSGRAPKIAACQGLGVFGIGVNEKSAVTALELFGDWIRVAVYAESFGGPLPMTREKIGFINSWEAENYRSQLSEKQ